MDTHLRAMLYNFKKEFPGFDVKKAHQLVEEIKTSIDELDFHMDRTVEAVGKRDAEAEMM